MENKNNGLIILNIVLIIIVLGLTAYIVYDKVIVKEENKTEEKIENNEESINDSETVNTTKNNETETLIYGEFSTKNNDNIHMTVTLMDNGIMQILSGDGYSMIEYTQGTYKIEDNKLIYNRIYSNYSDNGKDYWESNFDFKSLGLNSTEIFTIDNNTLTNDTYIKSTIYKDGKLILTKN